MELKTLFKNRFLFNYLFRGKNGLVITKWNDKIGDFFTSVIMTLLMKFVKFSIDAYRSQWEYFCNLTNLSLICSKFIYQKCVKWPNLILIGNCHSVEKIKLTSESTTFNVFEIFDFITKKWFKMIYNLTCLMRI